MPIDFGRLTAAQSADTVLEPREIFRALPNRSRKYSFPRDVQAEVWTRWFERRGQRDLVLKLNTGSGKTVVGLLLLKSCLNEGVGPAVYVAPSPYLQHQVIEEANNLGLAVEDDPRSHRFAAGQSILVTTIKTLFNGRSRFGLASDGDDILDVGSIIVDDAHACLQEVEEQFTLLVPRGTAVYDDLLATFREPLRLQSLARVDDLEAGDPNAILPVPFWSWHDALPRVTGLLRALQGDDKAQFVWPLLKDVLPECRCVFGAAGAEISPRMLPVDVVPSFAHARRRVFMGATFADDGVLVSHFDVAPGSLAGVVAPDNANDIGDRMILVPQVLTPDLGDGDLKAYLAEKARFHNVVVLVPSNYRASFWRDVAAQSLTASNLAAGVQALRSGHVGLSVIVNRYDGIDLPDDACRLLVIDGLPDVRRMVDKVEQGMRNGPELMTAEALQRIEQGMGRGNRAADDWCVVFLMGRNLTAQLYRPGARARFTAATRAQWVLSEQLSRQLEGRPLADVDEAIGHCLNRHADWVGASRGALVGLKYPSGGVADAVTVARRSAFNAARAGNLVRAVEFARQGANAAVDDRTRGWLLMEVASYQHRLDPAQAQVTLQSAKGMNLRVPAPLAGVTYQRLDADLSDQASRCLSHLRSRFPGGGNELIVAVHALCENLRFEPETAEPFERAMAALGDLVGFEAQRPEADFGRGPDVLWKMGGLSFAVIEAKNGATTDRISKSDCNQLAGSMNWFADAYDRSCVATAVMIHPSAAVFADATAPAGARVVTAERLPALADAVRAFAAAVATKPQFGTVPEVGRSLAAGGLSAATFLARHSVEMR